MYTRQLIENYHNAWAKGDFATARAFLADDLDSKGSIGKFQTADEFVAALRGFQAMLIHVTLLKSFYKSDGAALLYGCDTTSPEGVIRMAEFFTIKGDKISKIWLFFDAMELLKMMQPKRKKGSSRS